MLKFSEFNEEKTIEVTTKSGNKFTAPIKVSHKDWHIVKHPVSGKQYRVDHSGKVLEEETIVEDVDKAYADWQDEVKKRNPEHADKIKFKSPRDQRHVISAEHGDRSFGTFDTKTGKGEHLGEETEINELSESWMSHRSSYDGPGKGKLLGDMSEKEHVDAINYHGNQIHQLKTGTHKYSKTYTKQQSANQLAKHMKHYTDHKDAYDAYTMKEETELDEAVEVSHDRYMRSHGKKASGSGLWAFTHKRQGNVDYHNDSEFHQATGSFADAKKSAKIWAKKHGHSAAYVMEDVQVEEYQTKDKQWYQKPADHLKGVKAPVAPAPTIHRIGVTVSDPQDTAVSKRKETIQKFVRVHHHNDNKDEAIARGKKHFEKKGWKVHDAWHVGVMHEEVEQIDELKKSTMGSYVKKAAVELPAHQTNATLKHTGPIANAHAGKHPKTGESPVQWDDRKVRNRKQGIIRAVSKLAKEEVEQIDEISKETLKSYIPKAIGSKSAADFTRGVKMAQGSGGEEELRKKSEKRSEGIHKAIRKLTQEQTELEESHKFVNVATSKKIIAGAEKALKDNPNMWPGPKAGFKTLITVHKKHLEKAQQNESIELAETAYEKDMDDKKPVYAQGVKGMKSTPFTKKFKSMDHFNKWSDSEAAGNHEVHRVYQEDVEVSDDFILTEGLAVHGKYSIKTGPLVRDMGEGRPDYVKAHIGKLKKIDVKADAKPGDYGTTHRVVVKNNETGETTHHHVYQSDKSGNKPIMSIRTVGVPRANQDEHHQVLKDYLTGKKPTTQSVKEEAEQIDELSKYALQGYISKASVDMYDKGLKRGSSKWNTKTDGKKLVKRLGGIQTAARKLAKEETELAERTDLEKGHIEQSLADRDINSKVEGKKVQVHKDNVTKAKSTLKKLGYHEHEVHSGLNEETDRMQGYLKALAENPNLI